MPGKLILFTLLLFYTSSFSQDKPVPDYVSNRNFPDSVLRLPVVRLDGAKGSLSDVLSSVRGKKVVLDIWASWCRDCIVGLPKLEALMNETDPGKVAYVFLSIDQDDRKWRHVIQRFFKKQGEHYRIPIGWKNALTNYIVLDWVPRYLILDEDGRVIMTKAIEAGERQLRQSLLQDSK